MKRLCLLSVVGLTVAPFGFGQGANTFPASGNVGIGTTSPIANLHVVSSSAVVVRLQGPSGSEIDFSDGSALAPSFLYGSPYQLSFSSPTIYLGGQFTNNISWGNMRIGSQYTPSYTLDVTGTINASVGSLMGGAYIEKVLIMPRKFTSGVSNQAIDVVFGNQAIWGYVEVEVTSSYADQNSVGKLTKVFALGENPNNNIVTNESRTTDTMGAVGANVAIGEFSWDSTANRYRIPISHIVSTQNSYTVKVRVFNDASQTSVTAALYPAISLSNIYSLAALPRNFVNFNGNVGIGTSNPLYPLAVHGTIRAQEVIVDTGWSDYVFDDSYKIAPLSEVEAQIKADRHLPGIPSAKEVAEKGINLGDMQAKLLAKVEELTLHLIAQEKQLQEQQVVIEDQNARIKRLEHSP